MRVPYSWLGEYIADTPSVEAATAQLTVSGTMVEGVERVGVDDPAGAGGEHFVVARVLEFEQHPDADRLRLVQVDDGTGIPRQVVCGASNFAEGDNVALVTPGGRMPDGTEIRAAQLRGIDSHGMLLSERELGLSTAHDGIMILPHEWQPGDHLHGHVPLGDDVLELELTGNRPDCMGMLGVARELAVAASRELDASVLDGDAAVDAELGIDVHDIVRVEVEADDLCDRYMARAFVDVAVGPSPLWLKARLAHAGMRAINNVVDVTNYVMLVTGQPLHAFDADQLRGGAIHVRRAADGEQVTTLDDVQRTLDRSMLVIADSERPAVIAGIMGAADVEVSEATTRLVLEAASFNGPNIQQTSRALALRSESSARFEKGLDQHSPQVALRLASRLLVELCDARMLRGTIDVHGAGIPADPHRIELRADDASRLLGIEVGADATHATLTALGCDVAPSADGWLVTPPHWRMRDLTRPADLVEELGRFRLDQIPSIVPAIRGGGALLTRQQRMRRLLEDSAVGMGLAEVVTYGLVEVGTGEQLGEDASSIVRLANPMIVDHAELRTSMVPGHLDVARRNLANGSPDVAIFEIGRMFRRAAPGEIGSDGLPRFARERDALGMLFTGDFGGGRWDMDQLPADVHTAVGAAIRIGADVGVTLEPWPMERVLGWMHPGRAAELRTAAGDVAGWVATIHPRYAATFDVTAPVHAVHIDLAVLDDARTLAPRYQPISEFPPVVEDIAVIVDADVPAAQLVRTAREASVELLEAVQIVDRYVGAPVPEGSYSLALQLTFRAHDRTLSARDTTPARTSVVEALVRQHGARLRDH